MMQRQLRAHWKLNGDFADAQGCADGSDAVIARDWGWPQALSMSGEEASVFPFPGPGGATPVVDPVGPDGYGVRVGDFDKDGRAEVLIHDRTAAWIFRPPGPGSTTSSSHAALVPETGQGWYAL